MPNIVAYPISARADLLRRTDLFRGLPDPVVAEAAEEATHRLLGEGQILFSEHDQASGIYILARGQLRSIRQNREGREQVLSTESPGAILAAAPVFNGGKFYSTVIADQESEVLCLSAAKMHALCRKYPELMWNVAGILAHKLRHYAELIETLALRNVIQRVAQYLLTIARERATIQDEGCTFELTVTRTELASRIGSTREVVSRAISELQSRGLIHAKSSRLIAVPNLRALSTFAGTEYELEEPRLVSELSFEIA